ncbi:MAG: hypothetical protein ACKO5K_11635 [Armatimonadota bacterium]
MPNPKETHSATRIRSLGKPCRSRNVLAGRLVAFDGRKEFILTNMNEAANMELIRIDVDRRTAKVIGAPAGSGAWALNHLGGGRMAVGTYYDGTWMLYDVRREAWIGKGKFPGEDYLWNFAVGKDGRIFAGTYPGGKLGSYDPGTGAIEDCGAPTKSAGNQYLRYVSPLPDGRMFCYFGMSKTELRIWDPNARSWSDAPSSLAGTTWGTVWNGCFVAGKSAWSGPDLARIDPLPFPKPPVDEWNVDVALTDAQRLVIRSGRRTWTLKSGEARLVECPEMPFATGNILGIDDDGTILGVRGQDWFKVAPGKAPIVEAIPGEAGPRPTHFLEADDRGRVWGGPTFGQTLFHVDVRSGRTVNTRTVSDHGGEVYDVAVVDGICYAASYVGGEVIRYDPSAPWDQIGHVNPRPILTLTPDHIRPSGGIRVLPRRRLASGWMAKYGAYGGALAITDIDSGKSIVHRDPLGPFAIQGVCAAGDAVFITTTTSANGLPARTDTWSRIGLVQPEDGRVLWSAEVPGERSAAHPVHDPVTRTVHFVAEGRIRRVDLGEPRLHPVGDAPKCTGAGLALSRGRIVFAEDRVLKALDPANGTVATIAELPGKVAKLAAGPDRLYAMVGVELYEIKEARP